MTPQDTGKKPISAQLMFSLFSSCHALGARKPVLLKASGLTEPDIRNPEHRFPVRNLAELCNATAFELGCREASIHIGRGLIPIGFSDLGYLATFQPTRREMLSSLVKALDFDDNSSCIELQSNSQGDRLSWNGNVETYLNQIEECLVMVLFSAIVHMLENWTNGGLPIVKSVHLKQSVSRGFDNDSKIFEMDRPVPCFFGCRDNYIEFFPGMLEAANPLYNADILNTFAEQRRRTAIFANDAKPLGVFCYKYLARLLDKSGLSLVAAAESMNVAERTLRRKLVNEGTSFRAILEQVRKDTCSLYFLENQLSLTDIATKLGYSELSAFTRAYTAWYGHPPSRDMSLHRLMAA